MCKGLRLTNHSVTGSTVLAGFGEVRSRVSVDCGPGRYYFFQTFKVFVLQSFQ